MNPDQIAALLAPYLAGEMLTEAGLAKLSTYLDMLTKWNARMNLTSVRSPAEIVARHFGESVFTAVTLFPEPDSTATIVDVGSGAGFPGLPIAIARPDTRVTLIESHGKKATFLKEVIRATSCRNANVFTGRAEMYVEKADVVTFRAVEHFEAILPISASIVATAGRLAGLLGSGQVTAAEWLTGEGWRSKASVYFPGSTGRTLWIAERV
jgi:16S rRNA (guanine527-N7)-methyltransferase